MDSSSITINDANCPRVKLIYESSSVFIWSLRNQKLMFISKSNFSNNQSINCEFCIPKYRVGRSLETTKKCEEKFKTFFQLIFHIFKLEHTFRRALIWSNTSEIPNDLWRERELGDLSTLEQEPILKIEIDGTKLIHYQNVLRKYFRLNGCPCSQDCKVTVGVSSLNMFGHLSSIEKNKRSYVVFKASVGEVKNDDQLFRDCLIRKRGRPCKQVQVSTASRPFDSAESTAYSNFNSNICSNNYPGMMNLKTQANCSVTNQIVKRKRGRPFKYQRKCPFTQTTSESSSTPSIESKIIKVICEGKSVSVEEDGNGINNLSNKKMEFVFNDGIKVVELRCPSAYRSTKIIESITID